MRSIRTALSMCVVLVVAVAMPRAVSAQTAGKASLSVCNKGTVTVEVVAASLTSDLPARHWEVEGTSIAPGACESTYEGRGLRQRVFLGFGFVFAVNGTDRAIAAGR